MVGDQINADAGLFDTGLPLPITALRSSGTTHLLHTSTQEYTHFLRGFAMLCAILQMRPDFVR